MSRQSHAMESFSRLVVATVGALMLVGAVAVGFVMLDDHGCSSGVRCHTAAEMANPHY